MIPIIFLAFYTQVLTNYSILLIFRSGIIFLYKLVIIISWGCFQTIPVVVAFHVASKTLKKGQKMSLIIGKVINDSDDHEVISQLKTFMIQMRQRKAILTCGLFNIDWTLAFSIVGTITTYLVIICQFESENEED
ncbi:unnamed protein product [Diamesa hyperborea]